MPTTETIAVSVASGAGEIKSRAALTCRHWTKQDARMRALKYGGAVVLMCLLMVPIPIVHFFAIPVALFGIPLVTFLVYRLYSGGADLQGPIACPACGSKVEVRAPGDLWPVSRNCPDCRAAYVLERA